MESGNIRKILKRYLEGNASGQEKDSVNQWYQSFEDRDRDAQHHHDAKQEVWSRIEAVTRKSDRFTFTWLRAAAAILLIATAGTAAWLISRNTIRGKNETYSVLHTKTGERRSVTLADGSRLTLNSSTHMRVSDDFGEIRYVELIDGEVFFDVASDSQRPFIIRSGSLMTKVLGTSFNIRAYRESRDLSVSVVSGKVSVSEGNKLLNVLTPDQRLVFHRMDSTFAITGVPEGVHAWRQGIIMLEDIPFDEMALLVHRHYGVVMKAIDPQVKNTRYTATLRAEMKPQEAAEVLAAIHRFNVQSKQDTIMLYK